MKLFAMPAAAENIREAERFRFARVTADYILIWAEDGPGLELQGEQLDRLTDWDRAWLWECQQMRNRETGAERPEQRAKDWMEYFDALDAALERVKADG